MKEILLWNKDHTAAVKESTLRSIRVYSPGSGVVAYTRRKGFSVTGWHNSNDGRLHFDFGEFDTERQAVSFLEALCLQIAQ